MCHIPDIIPENGIVIKEERGFNVSETIAFPDTADGMKRAEERAYRFYRAFHPAGYGSTHRIAKQGKALILTLSRWHSCD